MLFLQQRRDLFFQTSRLCKRSKEHLLHMQRILEAPEALAMGLWIDGTPHNFDRSQTLECICLNFPGLVVPNASLRLPLCAIPRHLRKGKTLSKMLGVLSGSCIHWANALWPNKKHDGKPWPAPGDVKRSKRSSAAMPFPALGDWEMRKEVFSFPDRRDKKGCSQLCKRKPEELRIFDMDGLHEKLPRYNLMSWILETRKTHWWAVQNSRPRQCSILAGLVAHCQRRHCFRLFGQPLLLPSASENGRQQFDLEGRGLVQKHPRVLQSWKRW